MNNDEGKAKREVVAEGTVKDGLSSTGQTGQTGATTTMRAKSVQDGKDIASEAAVDQEVRNHLGRKLKESYDDLVRQPVPDKFRQLLDELERQEKK